MDNLLIQKPQFKMIPHKLSSVSHPVVNTFQEQSLSISNPQPSTKSEQDPIVTSSILITSYQANKMQQVTLQEEDSLSENK